MRVREVFRKKTAASVSVFFLLVLSLLLALLFALRTAVQKGTHKLQIEYAMNASMNAVFAEYHRQLLEQYDILAIDTSYGSNSAETQNTAEHLRDYMNGNFGRGLFGGSDMLGMYADSAQVEQVARLTDGGGRVLEQQIVYYMHTLTGLPQQHGVENYAQEFRRSESENPMEQLWGQANDSLADEELPTRTNDQGEEETVELENPADAVWNLRGLGILRLVVEDTDRLSNESLSQEELVSRRNCLEEDCADVVNYSLSAADRLLLEQYLFQKMGWYTNTMEKSRLKYQLEYLIGGELSDYDNLQKTANLLSLFRLLQDYRFLSNNEIKMAEIRALVTAMTAVTLKPELAPFITRTIVFAWAYVESVQDVKRLLEGGKVPIQKTEQDWRTGLEGLADFHHNLQGAGSENGLDYGGYLRIILFLIPEDTLVPRMMDLIESDIRKTEGNEDFRLDACIVSLDAEVGVSTGESEYYIRRKFAYGE